MLWVSLFPFFRESVEMVNVAVPLTSGTDPYVVPPSMNSTMPVGATPSEDCTLAVNVTGVFTVEGFMLDVSVVVVVPRLTVCEIGDDVLPVKVASPL